MKVESELFFSVYDTNINSYLSIIHSQFVTAAPHLPMCISFQKAAQIGGSVPVVADYIKPS